MFTLSAMLSSPWDWESSQMIKSQVQDRLQRFFFMRPAINEADERSSACGQAGVDSARAARSLLIAAESLEEVSDWQLSALSLLSHAAVFAAQGLAARRQLSTDLACPSASWRLVIELPEMQKSTTPVSAKTRDQILSVVANGLTSEYADWSMAELQTLKLALLERVRCAVTVLESDIHAPHRLRLLRILRWSIAILAVALLVGYAARKIHQRFVPVNHALNATVSMSSNYNPTIFPPASLVDGDTTKPGCHTAPEQNPWAVVDLGARRTIHRVVVTNRLEGLTGRAIPLLIETSRDGRTYAEFARKTDDFTTWTATAKPTEARYVRLTVLANSMLHLNEVAIF
jgi:hypothetical protein